ncbi:hypothetical protein BGZ79_005136 [Entomortierella chlamydospora]|nr:hypothetical protein BGZ79_005136 [Entomortierella chlamydospora]
MTYYNNSPRMDHFSTAPPPPRDTKPVYTNTGSNSYLSAAPTKISSPFDDDPPVDTYNNPYNPDYMHSSDNYNQSPFNSTHEHSLSSAYSEKAPPSAVVAGEQTYAMQHLSNNGQYDNSYNLNRDSYRSNNFYNGYDEDRPSLSNDTAPMRPYNDLENSDGLTRSKSGVTRVKYAKEKSKYLPCFPCIRSTCGRVTCCICLFLLLVIIALVIVVFTVFKLPTVNYLGTTADPKFEFNQGNTTLAVSFVAQIQVINPNPIGFKFESIVATVSPMLYVS